jgi:hypothetical protein
MMRPAVDSRTPPPPLPSGHPEQSLRTDHYSLWLLTIGPSIWAAHLLLCYITAAIWCAKFVEAGGPLGGVRSAIAAYTIVALAGIAWIGWEGYRRHRYPSTALGTNPSTALGTSATEATTHDLDSAGDRYRFLGFATLLLAGLSAVGVFYAALAATYFDTCR